MKLPLWLLSLFGFFYFLPRPSVSLTGDERVYLSTAWEMRETGSWLKPLLFGLPSYFKPPFQYWMTLLSWEWLGTTLAASLLPSAVAAVLAAFAVRTLARSFPESISREDAEHAPIWLFGSLGVLTFAWVAQMEIWLLLLQLIAWACALSAMRAQGGILRLFGFILTFAVVGALALVKSPLYSVLFTFGLVIDLAASPTHRRLLRSPSLHLSIVFGALIGAAWYAWILKEDPQGFYNDYVIRETIAKKSGNGSGPAGIWIAFLYWGLPATIPACFGFKSLLRNPLKGPLLRFLLAFALPMGAFFTLYPYRVSTYLFPLVPVLAILAPIGWRESGTARTLTRVFLAAGSAILFFLSLRIGGFSWLLLGTSALAFFATVASMRSKAAPRILFAALLAGIAFRLAAVELGERDLRDLEMAAKEASFPPMLGFPDPEKNIWNEGTRISLMIQARPERLFTPHAAENFLKSGGWVILCGEENEAPFREALLRIEDVDRTPWRRWKKRVKFPYRELLRFNSPLQGLERECEILHRKERRRT